MDVASPVDAAATDQGKDAANAKKMMSLAKLQQYRKHLHVVSSMYREMVLANEAHAAAELAKDNVEASRAAASAAEEKFMKILNSQATFTLSKNYRKLCSIWCSPKYYRRDEKEKRAAGENMEDMYEQYAPPVLQWIETLLGCKFPVKTSSATTNDAKVIHADDTLVNSILDGKVLCRLVEILFPRSAKCQLLDKGAEFMVHRLVFFLEICRTNGLKSKYIFSIENHFFAGRILARKSAVSVLRTLCAIEKLACKKGFSGAALVLKKPFLDSTPIGSKAPSFTSEQYAANFARHGSPVSSLASFTSSVKSKSILNQVAHATTHATSSDSRSEDRSPSIARSTDTHSEAKLSEDSKQLTLNEAIAAVTIKRDSPRPNSAQDLFPTYNTNLPRIVALATYIHELYNKFLTEELHHLEVLRDICKLCSMVVEQNHTDVMALKQIMAEDGDALRQGYLQGFTPEKLFDLRENLISRSADCESIGSDLNNIMQNNEKFVLTLKSLPGMEELASISEKCTEGDVGDSRTEIIVTAAHALSRAIADHVQFNSMTFIRSAVLTLGIKNPSASTSEPMAVIIQRLCNETRINLKESDSNVQRSNIVRNVMKLCSRLGVVVSPKDGSRPISALDRLKVFCNEIFKTPSLRIVPYMQVLDGLLAGLTRADASNQDDTDTHSIYSNDSAVEVEETLRKLSAEVKRISLLKRKMEIVFRSIERECNL